MQDLGTFVKEGNAEEIVLQFPFCYLPVRTQFSPCLQPGVTAIRAPWHPSAWGPHAAPGPALHPIHPWVHMLPRATGTRAQCMLVKKIPIRIKI